MVLHEVSLVPSSQHIDASSAILHAPTVLCFANSEAAQPCLAKLQQL